MHKLQVILIGMCCLPIIALAAMDRTLRDLEGNVVGELADFDAMCGHINIYTDHQHWNICFRKYSDANQAILAKLNAANKDILERRRKEGKNPLAEDKAKPAGGKSLSKEMAELQTGAQGIGLYDAGRGAGGDYTNTVTDASARAALAGKSLSDTHARLSKDLSKSLQDFDQAGSGNRRGTDSLYSGAKSLSASVSNDPAVGASDPIAAYQIQKHLEEQIQAIETARREAAQRRAAEERARIDAEQRAAEEVAYQEQLAAEQAQREAEEKSSGSAWGALFGGILQGYVDTRIASGKLTGADAANARQAVSAYQTIHNVSNMTTPSSSYTPAPGGAASGNCAAEEKQYAGEIQRITQSAGGGMCGSYRAQQQIYSKAAEFYTRCGHPQDVAEYRRAANQAAQAATQVCR